MSTPWAPKPYQCEALAFLLQHERCQLWLDKGLGKTSVALHAIADLMDRCAIRRVLVVSTRRITKSVWPREIEKWTGASWIPIRDIEGPPAHRARTLSTPWAGVETITFEKLKWLFREYLKGARALPWDLVIFDESSKLKAPGTQRFRALRHWQAALPRVWHLTGSPAPAGLLNVWAPAFLLDGGERLGRSFVGYKERWFRADFMGWKLEPLPGAGDHIHERLQDVTLSMAASDWLDLPPLIVNDLWVDLPPETIALYERLEREMFVDLERGTVEAANGGVLTNKCRQVANGALYVNGNQHEWQDVHEAKLEALDEVIEEAEGHPIIVAYQFRFDLARLRQRYPRAAVLTDDRVVDEWNRGEHPILLMHPASAGHGLNLQDGGQHMALFGAPWSFDQYDQCIDRIAGGLRRQRPTFIHRIVAQNTVDRDVLESLDTHCTIQEALKRRMRRVRAM